MEPFAGIYKSYLLPNQSKSIDARLDDLSWAIKMVYASTFTQEARQYAESTLNRTEEEKMAVILQVRALRREVVGEMSGDHFYPSLAGVANAVDFYPNPRTLSEHGCAQLGLGLGHTVGLPFSFRIRSSSLLPLQVRTSQAPAPQVVDGQPALHFSLGDTKHPVEPQNLMVAALDLSKSASCADALVSLPIGEDEVLRTVQRGKAFEIAPEAAQAVPLSQDVHGEQVVFNQKYGK
ncbi:MAG: hypothetical protein SGPRY_007186, partial [Prymnesium sp.]